ncbi:MAG TPA: rhodanese-like domain-containing protein [Candidatus Limnocylindria bacterium]|jgi:rhodanese-related sulfurtransferase|nr:rhodanese-like domain-containing protein [Candidatus Limnocylindria bacterium]
MKAISPRQADEKLKAGVPLRLLDVRETDENAFVTLPHATLIPLGELEDRVAELSSWANEEVVVYCHHGIRSAHGAAILLEHGFKNVANLTGGIDRWSLEVDPSLPRY